MKWQTALCAALLASQSVLCGALADDGPVLFDSGDSSQSPAPLAMQGDVGRAGNSARRVARDPSERTDLRDNPPELLEPGASDFGAAELPNARGPSTPPGYRFEGPITPREAQETIPSIPSAKPGRPSILRKLNRGAQMSESPHEGSTDIRDNQWRIEADRSANGNDPTAERKDPSPKRRMTDRIEQWRMTARAQLIRPKQTQSAPPISSQPPASATTPRKGLQGWFRSGADAQE